MDTHTPKQRSLNMSKIRSKNTKPELLLRKKLWTNKIRGYRLNSKISGKPDLYFSHKKIAIFIDGCFWHKCPTFYIRPKSRNKYWDSKLAGNLKRDSEVNKILKKQAIKVFRIWEHEIYDNIELVYVKLQKDFKKTN